jgi:hypothetical protein
MVKEGSVKLAAALQTGPGRGKSSLEAAAARLYARRGPLQHGAGRYDKMATVHSIPKTTQKGGSYYRRMIRTDLEVAAVSSTR